jgi:hypothetical protein
MNLRVFDGEVGLVVGRFGWLWYAEDHQVQTVGVHDPKKQSYGVAHSLAPGVAYFLSLRQELVFGKLEAQTKVLRGENAETARCLGLEGQVPRWVSKRHYGDWLLVWEGRALDAPADQHPFLRPAPYPHLLQLEAVGQGCCWAKGAKGSKKGSFE